MKTENDTTDYKQIAYKLQSDIEDMKWFKADEDLKFLKEIKQKLVDSREKRDPTLFDHALEMIGDWIRELEESVKEE